MNRNNVLSELSKLGEGLLAEQEKDLLAKKLEGIEQYKEYLRDNKVFEVAFDVANADGDLIATDENRDVTVILNSDTFKISAEYYTERIKHKFLAFPLKVSVDHIDEEKRYVYVKSAYKSREEFENNDEKRMQQAVISSLRKEIDAGRTPRVWGRVAKVNNKNVLVRIFDKNITARIRVQEWNECYIRDLRNLVRVNELYVFDVVSYRNNYTTEGNVRKDGNYTFFNCSRINIAENPWKNIDTDVINVDGNIKVTCVEAPVDKKYCWGISKSCPGIEIMMQPSAYFPIRVGMTYTAKIKFFEPELRNLVVRPFEMSTESLNLLRKDEPSFNNKNIRGKELPNAAKDGETAKTDTVTVDDNGKKEIEASNGTKFVIEKRTE